jgi:hypothetical protein
MEAVRHALAAARPGEATVTRIATDHGFFELGRFAAVYSSLFGERPSETLRGDAAQMALPAVNRAFAPQRGSEGTTVSFSGTSA